MRANIKYLDQKYVQHYCIKKVNAKEKYSTY